MKIKPAYRDLKTELSKLKKSYRIIEGELKDMKKKMLQAQLLSGVERFAEERLKESERLYRSLFENMQEGFSHCEMIYKNGIPADFVFLDVNEKFVEITGLQNLRGKKISEIFPGYCKQDHELLEIYDRVCTSGQQEKFEYFHKSLGKWFLMSVYTPGENNFVAVFDAIDDRKKTEDALRKSEVRFRELSDLLPQTIYEADLSGRIMYANQSAFKLFGYCNSDIDAGLNILDTICSCDRDRAKQSFSNVLKGTSSRGDEYIAIRHDGSIFPIIIYSSPIFSENIVTGIRGVIFDNTEHKNAEAELNKQKNFFEQMFTQSFVSTQILDKDGWCERINPKLTELFGVLPENIEGRRYNIFKDQEIINSGVIKHLEKVFHEGKTVEWEVNFDIGEAAESQNIAVKENKKVWFYNLAFPIFDENHNLTNVIIQHTDISNRKKVELSLLESEKKYRLLYESAGVGIGYYGINGEIFSLNPVAAARLKGLPENFQGKTIYEVLPEKSAALFLSRLKSTIYSDKTFEYVDCIELENEKQWLLSIFCRILDDHNGIEGVQVISTDITGQKNAEALVIASEEKFRMAFEHAVFAIALVNSNLKFMSVNQAFCNLMGYSQEEIKSKSFSDITHPDDILTGMDFTSELYKGERDYFWFEKRYLHKDGHIIYCILSSSIVRDTAGNPLFTVAQIQDITERKKAEAELIEVNEIQSSILRVAMDGFWLTDDEGKILEVNKTYCNMIGYSEEELLQLKISDIDCVETFSESLHHFKKIAEMGEDRFETKHRRKDGSFFEAEISVQYKKGKEGYFVSFIRDITQRKQYENKIAEKSKLLDDMMDNSSSLIYMTDKEGRYISVNRQFEKLLDKTRSEIIGRDRNVFFPPDIAKEHFQNDLEVIHLRTTMSFEEMNIEPDGTHYYFTTKFPLIDSQNNLYGVSGISTDITERKNTEVELIRAKERAEESDRLKSAFLANMSHEIRTPMNAIIGFSELLSQEAIDDLKRQRFAVIIKERSRDLLRIVEDILDISKIEVGQMKISESSFLVAHLLDDLYFEYLQKIKITKDKSDIRLNLTVPAEMKDTSIKADSQRLKQMLTNLLDNALKFTLAGSIEFGCKTESENLIFFVKDTGIGIPDDKKDIIFDRFRQADEIYNSRKYNGAGLGLSIVKGIANLMKGKIWVESEINTGTIFYLSIPFTQAGIEIEEVNDAIHPEYKAWKNKTILIVEDIETNRELLKSILAQTNIRCLYAANGEEAMLLFNEYPEIEIVLMDIRLPDTNGLVLTRLMKNERPELIIIAQTAYASSSDAEACIDAGCNEYISKPIYPPILLSLVGKYINR